MSRAGSNGGNFRRFRGGRGGERAFVEKIPVEHLFQPGVRPASVLIGVRGTNHARLQSSGCLVQLRGKGCSPDPATNEGPIHLQVKYDTPEQLERLKAIMNEIVTECNQTSGKRVPQRQQPPPPPAAPTAAPAVPTPPPPPPPPAVVCEDFTVWVVDIDGWALREREIYPQELQAECDLLWFFKVFLLKEKSVPIEGLASGIASFFHVMAIDDRVASTSIPKGPRQINNFVFSCPHLFRINGENVSLVERSLSLTKDALRDFHTAVRREQHAALVRRGEKAEDPESQLEELLGRNPAGVGRRGLPLDALTIFTQATHAFLASQTNGEYSLSEIPVAFESVSSIPFAPSTFGYDTSLAFFRAMPTIFRVIEPPGGHTRIGAMENPNFADVFAAPPVKVGFLALAKALRANAAAARQQQQHR